MASVKTCFKCKQKFLKTELVDYASSRSITYHSYCKNCLALQQSQDKFSDKVCEIFGIMSPGPRIWRERKKLLQLGYTDNVICECLDYIYNIKKLPKLAESLCLINSRLIEEMKTYKKRQEIKGFMLANAISQTNIQETVVPIRENIKEKKKTALNPDDWLNID